MKLLYIIRHGETDWNLQGKVQGKQDSQLTKLGLKQAELLANRLMGENIEVIYSSGLQRAISTASIIADKLNLPYFCNDALNEINFGLWEGLTNEEILKEYPAELRTWRNSPHKSTIPGGEKLALAQKRAVDFVRTLVSDSTGKNILLVSHATIIKLLLMHILEMELYNYYRLKQDNCNLNVVAFRDHGPVLLKYNDVCHIVQI